MLSVRDVSDPCLHGDTLENCQHGEADVIEGGDAVVGPLPLLGAERHREVAGEGSAGCRGSVAVVTRNLLGALRHDLICRFNTFLAVFSFVSFQGLLQSFLGMAIWSEINNPSPLTTMAIVKLAIV